MFGGICEEGGGHVLLVPRGAAQAAVPTLLACTVPAEARQHYSFAVRSFDSCKQQYFLLKMHGCILSSEQLPYKTNKNVTDALPIICLCQGHPLTSLTHAAGLNHTHTFSSLSHAIVHKLMAYQGVYIPDTTCCDYLPRTHQ